MHVQRRDEADMNGMRGAFIPRRTGTGDLTVLVDDPHGRVRVADVEKLYRKHGQHFARWLSGDCAVAVSDLRGESAVVLFSTGSGNRPLHYAWDAAMGAWQFGGHLPELLDRVAPVVEDETALDVTLATGAPIGRRTPFHGVETVLPASTVVIEEGRGARSLPSYGPTDAARHCPVSEPAAMKADLTSREAEACEGEGHSDRSPARALVACDPMLALAAGLCDTGRRQHLFTPLRAGDVPPRQPRLTGVTQQHVEIAPDALPGLFADVTRALGMPPLGPEQLLTLALLRAAGAAGFAKVVSGDGMGAALDAWTRVGCALRAPGGLRWVGPYLDALAPVPKALRHRLYTREYELQLRSFESSAPPELMVLLTDAEGARKHRIATAEVGLVLPARFSRPLTALAAEAGVTAQALLWPAEELWPAAANPPLGEGRSLATVQRRAKRAFAAGVFVPGEPLWAMARDVLSPAVVRAEGRLRPDAVAALFTEQELRPREELARALWALTAYQVWRRQHFGPERRSL
ncbi:hypothetical protein ABZ408_39660 [Streptomyces tibetensis]|uniref:hypothetical protein n=1 Tax=Streptomyces tibetensis TaxID=2382123 RepID=UPI0033FB82EE